MKLPTDTIAAIATPPGRGGIGIVRISGPDAAQIAQEILGTCPPPRQATICRFSAADGLAIDRGLALFFYHPRSFTGEDVLELHGHGGPVVLDLLLQRVLQVGARLARPGEFSERAFLNGKIDLAQAEAIADLIDASSAQAARSAIRSLEGAFSRQVHSLVEAVTQLRMYVEATIDFPDEDIDFLSEGRVLEALQAIQESLLKLMSQAQQGALLRDGITVAIAGPPNAGKSSLLNALAGRETAIVTPLPGTTRDVLHDEISLDGLPLHLVDTAGLRESQETIERIGIERAWGAISTADRVLVLMDSTAVDLDGALTLLQEIRDTLPGAPPMTLVRNKADLSGEPTGLTSLQGLALLTLSAKTGDGLPALRAYLKQACGFQESGEGGFSARRRHLNALAQAGDHLEEGRLRLTTDQAGELLAEELRLAQQALGGITGEVLADDLLGRIFGSFCLGK